MKIDKIENFELVYNANQLYLTEKLVDQMTQDLFLCSMIFSKQPQKTQCRIVSEKLYERKISYESFSKLLNDIQTKFDWFPSLNQILAIIKTEKKEDSLKEIKIEISNAEEKFVSQLKNDFIKKYSEQYLYECTLRYVDNLYSLNENLGLLPNTLNIMRYTKCFLVDWYDSDFDLKQVVETAKTKSSMIGNKNSDLICLYLNEKMLPNILKETNGKTYSELVKKQRMRT